MDRPSLSTGFEPLRSLGSWSFPRWAVFEESPDDFETIEGPRGCSFGRLMEASNSARLIAPSRLVSMARKSRGAPSSSGLIFPSPFASSRWKRSCPPAWASTEVQRETNKSGIRLVFMANSMSSRHAVRVGQCVIGRDLLRGAVLNRAASSGLLLIHSIRSFLIVSVS